MQTEATKLHVVAGELKGRTFDIVTKRADGSVITYVACDVVKEIAYKVAAAPEMYEALATVLAFDANSQDGLCDYPGFGSEGGFQSGALTTALDAARAALSKARGEA